MITGFCVTRASERARRIVAKMSRVAPLMRTAVWPEVIVRTAAVVITPMIATITSSSTRVKPPLSLKRKFMQGYYSKNRTTVALCLRIKFRSDSDTPKTSAPTPPTLIQSRSCTTLRNHRPSVKPNWRIIEAVAPFSAFWIKTIVHKHCHLSEEIIKRNFRLQYMAFGRFGNTLGRDHRQMNRLLSSRDRDENIPPAQQLVALSRSQIVLAI